MGVLAVRSRTKGNGDSMNKADYKHSANARSALTRLGFAVKASFIKEETCITFRNKNYPITAEMVRQIAQNSIPEPITDFYVEVEGKRFPPMQLIRLALENRVRVDRL